MKEFVDCGDVGERMATDEDGAPPLEEVGEKSEGSSSVLREDCRREEKRVEEILRRARRREEVSELASWEVASSL